MTKEFLKKILPVFKDERGAIFDILDGVEIKHIGLITSRAGTIRGNHYHKIATQYTYVLKGKIELITKNLKGKSSSVIMDKGYISVHRPEQIHTLKFLEDSTILFFTNYQRQGSEGYEKDTYKIQS